MNHNRRRIWASLPSKASGSRPLMRAIGWICHIVDTLASKSSSGHLIVVALLLGFLIQPFTGESRVAAASLIASRAVPAWEGRQGKAELPQSLRSSNARAVIRSVG